MVEINYVALVLGIMLSSFLGWCIWSFIFWLFKKIFRRNKTQKEWKNNLDEYEKEDEDYETY